jgi:hypothetical protein
MRAMLLALMLAGGQAPVDAGTAKPPDAERTNKTCRQCTDDYADCLQLSRDRPGCLTLYEDCKAKSKRIPRDTCFPAL